MGVGLAQDELETLRQTFEDPQISNLELHTCWDISTH